MENNKYYRKDPLDIRKYFNNDSDYTTNSPSYYETLARFTTTLRLLTERLDDVEGRVIDLFLDWLRDGVIEEIINVNIFTDLNNRLNKIRDDFDSHIENEFTDLVNDFNNLFNAFELFVTETNENLDTLQQDINTLRSELNDLKSKVNKHVPENHYVSTAFIDLQQAVYGAEGGTLYIKPDTYLIDKPIKIRSNTTIIAYGSIFRRNADIDNMFINDSNGTRGGYGANKNITIIGATFDGAGGSFQDKCTMLSFGHAENILIKDCVFKNLVDWHMLEINGVKKCIVEHCVFENYGTSIIGSEMLQIDIFTNSNAFPWFGPYDNTVCDNITIRNNLFKDGVRGVGTHTSRSGFEHTRINIINNEFINFRKEAIFGLDWAFTKIHSNHMSNVHKGIYFDVKARSVLNHSIMDNYLSGISSDEDSRGIQINGVQDGVSMNSGTISNNILRRFGGHGIGVDYSRSWSIEGNEVTLCGKSGIIVHGADYCNITNNRSRQNNALGGIFHSITLSSTTTNTVIDSNNIEDCRVTSTVSNVVISNNIITDTLSISGDNINRVNNIVKGVFS